MKKNRWAGWLAVLIAVGMGMSLRTSVTGAWRNCAAPLSSVVAWYRAEQNGADSAGVSDGYALHGLSFAPGKVGSAFRFDGLDDRVVIPGSAALNVGEGGGFAVELWVNPATLTSGKAGIPLVEWNDGRGNAGAGVQLWLSRLCLGNCREAPGVLFADMVDSQGQTHLLQTGLSTMRANEFQHLVLTYDKATGAARLYRNGESEQGGFFGGFTPMTNRALALGHRPNSNHAVFDGLMDEVTIHNRWLTPEEIRALYQSGAAGKCAPDCAPAPAGLRAWFRAEGNAQDAGGLHAGQLRNGAAFVPGKVGQAFDLDGVDDGVEIPDAPSLKPTRLSVEAWARFDSLDTPGAAAPGLQYLVFKRNSRTTQFEGYALYKQRIEGGDRLAFGIASAAGAQAIAVSKTRVVTGRFYHVVGVYAGDAVRLYVNGVLEAELPANAALDYGERPLWIGESGESYNGRFKGQIDEASIYGEALDAQAVQRLFAAQTMGKCPQSPANTPPAMDPAAPITRQQGSAASESVIATVRDEQSAAGALTVRADAPAGIQVTAIRNAGGVISAELSAQCNAPAGPNVVVLTVTDEGGASASANLTVMVAGNSLPRLGDYPSTLVSAGGETTASPGAAPADNGSIRALTVSAPGFAGTLSINPATGVIRIRDAGPPGAYRVEVRATDNCGADSAVTFPLMVAKYEAAIALTASAARIYSPQSLRLSAAVTGAAGAPRGTVSFRDGATALGATTLDAQGRATFDAAGLSPGTHAFTAVYNGDDDYATNTSAAASVVVVQANEMGLASAANFAAPVAPDSVVSVFGRNLATATQAAATLPLPTTLAGTVVKVLDASGVERAAPLFFVSAAQINCLLPRETAPGLASVVISAGDGSLSFGTVEVAATAPGLFTVDGSGNGLAAGFVLRVKPDGSTTSEPLSRYDPVLNRMVAVPIDFGPATDQMFLALYATGLRYHTGLASIRATIAGETAPVEYAGQQGSFVGVDQLNLRLLRTLAGRGDAAIAVTVGNRAVNHVRVNFK
jgi:uncharacterized protein (TIGR03437 family)